MNIRALQEELEKERAILKSAKDRIAVQNAELEHLRKELQRNGDGALEDVNSRFRELVGSIQCGICSVDEHGVVMHVNEPFCRMFGITVLPETLAGAESAGILQHISQAFREPEAFTSMAENALKARMPFSGDDFKLINGHILSCSYIPVYTKDAYKGQIWKFTDVTRNKTIGDTFDAQRKFYEQILNNIPADIVVFSPDHKYLFVNPVAVSKPELRKWMIGKSDDEYCAYTNKPADIAETRRAAFNNAITTKSKIEWEERYEKPDCALEHYVRILYPVLNVMGDVEMVIVYGLNITQRKKIEEQIKLSEKRFREIFNFSQAWIGTHDIEGRILTMNPAACNMLGYSMEELTGRKLDSLMPEKVRAQFSEVYLKTIHSEGKADGIMSIRTRQGKTIYLLYQNYLVNEVQSEPYIIGFAQDITQRIHAEEALKASEERYKGIIENMNLGMIEMDPQDCITFANQRFCAMSGYELNELIGKKATDLFLYGASLKKTRNELQKRQYRPNTSYELTVKTKTGEERWWFTSATPVFSQDENLKGTISIHLDITEQKKLEEQLRIAKQETERSSRSKDIFLTNMSHEIRTPLNAIMGLGKLLSKSDLDTQQKNYLNGIESASNNLLNIINDILDFSKIEAGKITLENISFSLRTIAQQAVNVLEHKAEEKGLRLSQEIDERIAPILMGDPFRINQIFMNMLSNAIKFTEKGSVYLRAFLQEEAENEQKILVIIEDTGVGIKEEYLDAIFDKFTQEDETVVRKFGGTGLGMSITKQLMELMGGSIKVTSKKNVGTTVSLTFRFKIGTARVFEKKRTIKNETGSIGGKRILLVEDNALNRLLAYTILTDYGAVVSEAENGLEAVEKLRREKFDVVLMDIQMPVMDGIQATKIIRDEISKSIPILALTANAIKGKENYFIESGMNDYIFKPYNEINLVNPIAKWLNKADEQHTSFPKEIPAAPPEPVEPPVAVAPVTTKKAAIPAADAEPLYDLSKLKSLARNDTAFIIKMLNLFIEETPNSVEKIKEGYSTGDYTTVRYYAHRMKPSITNLAINSLKDDVLKIEFMEDNNPAAVAPLIEKLDNVIKQVIDKLKAEYDLS